MHLYHDYCQIIPSPWILSIYNIKIIFYPRICYHEKCHFCFVLCLQLLLPSDLHLILILYTHHAVYMYICCIMYIYISFDVCLNCKVWVCMTKVLSIFSPVEIFVYYCECIIIVYIINMYIYVEILYILQLPFYT